MSGVIKTALPEQNPAGLWLRSRSRTDPRFTALLGGIFSGKISEVTSGTAIQQESDPDLLQDEITKSSTSQRGSADTSYRKLETLFTAARELEFEDGMETEFSRNLVFIVQEYGTLALAVLFHFVEHKKVNEEVLAEALRWVGRMKHPATHRARLRLLEQCLGSSSLLVRDGALLGLASMDDPNSIPYIQRSIRRESCEELRRDMSQVLDQLTNHP